MKLGNIQKEEIDMTTFIKQAVRAGYKESFLERGNIVAFRKRRLYGPDRYVMLDVKTGDVSGVRA